eukprot:scaffold974_cov91-Skeletonema_marinoi.AAC.1
MSRLWLWIIKAPPFGPGGATDVSLEDGRRSRAEKAATTQLACSLQRCSGDAQASSMLSTTTYSTTWYYTLR